MTNILSYDQYVSDLKHQTHDKMTVVCSKCGSDMKCVWSKILKSGNMVGVWQCKDHRSHLKYKVALRLTMKRLYIEYLHKMGKTYTEAIIGQSDYIVR